MNVGFAMINVFSFISINIGMDHKLISLSTVNALLIYLRDVLSRDKNGEKLINSDLNVIYSINQG